MTCRLNHLVRRVRDAHASPESEAKNLLAMVLTVTKAVDGPSLSVRVTGPSAPDQVRLKGLPAVMVLKVGLVNSTAAWAIAKAAVATMSLEKSIIVA